MSRESTKKIVLNGVMIALVFLLTYFTRIPGPIPPGYLNFGDVIIMLAAILLGRNSGFAAGALGSVLVDIISPGGMIFAPVTLVVKGLEGYITGAIASPSSEKEPGEFKKIIAVAAGALVMVAGYFFAEVHVLKLFDNTFGYTYAIGELPLNLVQGGVSAVVAYIVSVVFKRVNMNKYIK